MADELARGAVLRALDGEDGVLAHPGGRLLVLGGAARWQLGISKERDRRFRERDRSFR